jgi:hypothetical protein
LNALPPSTDDRIIWDTWLAAYRVPVLTVADEVGTFRVLSEKPLGTDALAAELNVDARALKMHLGLLASLGFVERRDDRWNATAATRTWLHPDAEGYCGPLIRGFRDSQPLHAQLLATLRTGQRPHDYVSAADEWERGEMPDGLAVRITAYMNAHSRASAKAVAVQPLFAEVRSLLDVGGGSAIFPIELSKVRPEVQSTVMEIEAICKEADRYIRAADAQASVKTQAVDMFRAPWPQGHDAHFFSNIFHDWSDETCRLLARKSFEALAPGGRILLHEMLMDDDGCGPTPAAAFSVLMLLGTKGRQYTLPELRGFLEGAGFVDVQSSQTGGGYYSLVSARKPTDRAP